MNCPYCPSPAPKEQSKKTTLGYRTFRCSACHGTFNERNFHPVQLSRLSHRCRPSGCLLAAALQVEEPTALADPITTTSAPQVINVDKNAAYPKAIADLKAAGILPASVELRQVKYLNNLVEQDPRFIKRLVKPGMGFFSRETAGRTLQGYEVMNMIRKGQVHGVNKGDSTGQMAFVARLFGVAA